MPEPIIVTGMPRSGTSLICGVLDACGIDFGETIGSDQYAPTGYFERQSVITFNQIVLESLGGNNVIPPPGTGGIREHPAYEGWLTQVRRFLGEATAVKVPRAALIHPLWSDAAPNARWIVAVRHPGDIEESWRHTYGMSGSFYWHRYYSVLLQLPALFVSFESWFRDPAAELQRLCAYVGVEPTDKALRLVRSEHRHYASEQSASFDPLYCELMTRATS